MSGYVGLAAINGKTGTVYFKNEICALSAGGELRIVSASGELQILPTSQMSNPFEPCIAISRGEETFIVPASNIAGIQLSNKAFTE